MASDDDWLERLIERREEIGTRELADELGIPAPSLRRIISTGEPGRNLGAIREALGDDDEEPDEDDDDDELAALYGVKAGDIDALRDAIGEDVEARGMTRDELTSYIDDLYEVLTQGGWDLDVSDLWDMFYGYAPGSHGAS